MLQELEGIAYASCSIPGSMSSQGKPYWPDPILQNVCNLQVKGTSADERIRSKLDCVKEVLERPKMDYDSNPDMAHRLLAQLTIDREICPPTFSGIETFQALLLKNKPSSAKEVGAIACTADLVSSHCNAGGACTLLDCPLQSLSS